MKQIGNIEGVSEVWATDVALYIKTEGGFTLSWLYTPNVNVDAIRPAARTGLSRQGKAGTRVMLLNNISTTVQNGSVSLIK